MMRSIRHSLILFVLSISLERCASIKTDDAKTLDLTLCRYVKDPKDSDGGFFRCESEEDSYRIPMGMAEQLIAMPFEDLRKLLR